MRRAGVVPFRRRSPWRRRVRWPRPGEEVRAALIWAALIAALALGYGLGAPAVDDWRSARRPMSPGCRVARVVDGDTLDLVCPGRGAFRARIVGYDAPELFSPRCIAERDAAVRATRVLRTWARTAKTAEVAFLGRDGYGRTLVDMRLGGQRVARAMVRTGNGRRYLGGHRGGWCQGRAPAAIDRSAICRGGSEPARRSAGPTPSFRRRRRCGVLTRCPGPPPAPCPVSVPPGSGCFVASPSRAEAQAGENAAAKRAAVVPAPVPAAGRLPGTYG